MDGHAVAVEELWVVGEVEHLGPEEVVLLLLAGRELGVKAGEGILPRGCEASRLRGQARQ